MCTEKWPLVDRLVGTIAHIGSVHFLYGGFQKGSHKIFKKVDARRSKRQPLVMSKAVSRYNEISCNEHLPDGKGKQRARQNPSKIYGMVYVNETISRSVVRTTLALR